MSVTVGPETFSFVEYAHDNILSVAEQAVREAALPEHASVHFEVVESSPLGRVTVDVLEPDPPARARFLVEGGAFENLKAPRTFDPDRAAEVLGRLSFRLADVLDPGFGFTGQFDGWPVPRLVAWDISAVGRLHRLGHKVSHDRWLYLFRNRHGFTDDADMAFEALWSGQPSTWDEIRSLSETLKPDSEISARRAGARQG